MVKVSIEKYDEAIEELKPLFEDHWEEIAVYQDSIKLDPDYSKYIELERLGILKLITIRDGGVLVGYNVLFIQPHLHYSQDIYASSDIIFIKPEYRNAGVGMKLLGFTEEVCKLLGVSVIIANVKCHQPFDELLTGMGYDYIERIYSKNIKD